MRVFKENLERRKSLFRTQVTSVKNVSKQVEYHWIMPKICEKEGRPSAAMENQQCVLLEPLISLLGATLYSYSIYRPIREPFQVELRKQGESFPEGSNFLKGPSCQRMVKKQGGAFARQSKEAFFLFLTSREILKRRIYTEIDK